MYSGIWWITNSYLFIYSPNCFESRNVQFQMIVVVLVCMCIISPPYHHHWLLDYNITSLCCNSVHTNNQLFLLFCMKSSVFCTWFFPSIVVLFFCFVLQFIVISLLSLPFLPLAFCHCQLPILLIARNWCLYESAKQFTAMYPPTKNVIINGINCVTVL